MSTVNDSVFVREICLKADPGVIHGEVQFSIVLKAAPGGMNLSLENVEAAFREALVNIIEGKK